MGKYEKLAKDIIVNVGGKENINSLGHCVTRLRFQLKDESKANDDVLKNMDGVVTVMKSGGQYQVVIGNHVPFVYEDVCKFAGLKEDSQSGEAPKGIFNKLIDIISACFQPFLGALCAAGMIKGLNALFIAIGWLSATDGTYMLLNAIGDSVFMFLPIFIGHSSAKKFGVNPYIGMAIGAALCYPTIQGSVFNQVEPIAVLFKGTILESAYHLTFLKIPFIANDYTSSVVPVIIVVAFAAQVQKVAKKIVPEMIQNFFVPFLVLLIALPVGFLVIGPIITILTNLLGDMFRNINDISPILMAILVGFFWQVLVIFGLHWSLIPLMLINMTSFGFDNVLVGMFGASFAQTAVVAAMYFKLKDEKLKALCIPAVVSGICGVTEPAIYGITLPKKTPFLYSMIGGAAGGIVMAVMSVKSYTMGGLGIFGLPNFINQASGNADGMYAAILCICVSATVGFLLTFFFWNDKTPSDNKVIQKGESLPINKDIIVSPLKGEIVPLTNLKDNAFSTGALGKGLGIIPVEGKVVAPVDGTVTTLFPTLHAIGITGDSGIEVLIHIGLDTVRLEGEGFHAEIAQGDKVKKGQLLVTFDIKKIEAAGYSLETPIIITNSSDFLDIVETDKKNIDRNEDLITVLF